jgi:excisionase family DNA binding protein
MEQKFVTFEEAFEQLGISADQLNELRERGVLRAYRDGSSWKFRTEEIAKMSQEGVPEPPPPSDIGLVAPEDLVAAEPLDVDPLGLDDEEFSLEEDDDDTKISKSSPMLKAQDDSALEAELGDTDSLSAGSELELAEMEDTVTADASDLVLENVDQPSDPSDSILLSEEELGESVGAHPSKIIGKSDLEGEDVDLELTLDDDSHDDVHGKQSDVKLAPPGASDVHSSKIAGSGVLDSEEAGPGGDSGAFEDLEELEIDLAAESSRVLSHEDVEQTQAASKPATPKQGDSSLRLDDEDASIEDNNNMGSTDVPMLDREGEQVTADEGSDSKIDLADDGDLVLNDPSGSDITLDSGDSGINLVAPADSGLALDDIPLDIGGSAILSSLSLGGDSDPDISLVADSEVGKESASLQTDDDFQLTPLSEAAQEADGDSSSQVIALDADIEELGESAVAQFEEVDLTGEADEAVVLTEDFSTAPAGDLGVGYAPSATAAVAMEFPYSVPNVLALFFVAVLLAFAGVMMLDMVWNIWSWQEPYSMSSSLLDALLGVFGMN